MLTHPKNLEGSVTVQGEHGTVRLGGTALNRIEHWAFAQALPDDAQVQALDYAPASVYGDGHTGYYANVLDAISGIDSANTNGHAGLQSLGLVLAAYESARTHQFVHTARWAAP